RRAIATDLLAFRQWFASWGHRPSLRRTRDAGATGIGHVIRVEPGRSDPAILVVFGEALLGERDHAVERAGATCAPQRLDADVLVIAGVVPLVELVAAAKLGADRVP